MMIAAVVLAAGQSRRMGRPKLSLPWGEANTVIGQVVDVLAQAGLSQVLVIVGGARQEVEKALEGKDVGLVYNPHFVEEEMSSSLKVGLSTLDETIEAALVVLGDQPQIEVEVVRAVIGAYQASQATLVVPSYQMRRGHPWLVDRSLWTEVLSLPSHATLKHMLDAHAGEIHYVAVDTASILKDLDTPGDYDRERPG
jgi:molybdenum cofactor cytidylyltransferase